MLNWKVGLSWRIRIVEPGLECLEEHADTGHGQMNERIVEFKVEAEEEDYWVLSVRNDMEPYKLTFFRSPLSLRSAKYYYEYAPTGDRLSEKMIQLEEPGDFVQAFLSYDIPFILDFPKMEAPLEDGETLEKVIEERDLRCEFLFTGGNPFWTRAMKYRNDVLVKEGWLLE